MSADQDQQPAVGVWSPEPLTDPGRVRALTESGLSETPDAVLDELAERVRRWLGVPVALVSLVQPGQQVFPGQAGLPAPWSHRRRTPLSHSFCQHVVATSEPLVVVDAREDPRVRDNLAVRDLSVIAYAGMPLTDVEGRVLGSLCAIDVSPRRWTDHELDVLGGLAVACSAELRLRLARVDAERERERRDRVERDLSASSERSQLLLRASQTLTGASGMADVRRRLVELVSSTLRPSWVGLALADEGGGGLRLHDGAPDTPAVGMSLNTPPDVPGEVTVDAGSDAPLPSGLRSRLAALRVHTALVLGLADQDDDLGLLVLGWPGESGLGFAGRLFATTVAGYVAQAVARVRFVEGRVTVAHEMQAAMLAPLPVFPDVELAARYRAADDHEDVGGDWYDASVLPDPAGPSTPMLAVSVGDVVGHTLDSAIRMGKVRSMLRQAAWDVAGGPSVVLTAVERAIAGDGLGLVGTAVLAHLRRLDDGGWALRWTNAGHPPPIVVPPEGPLRLLDGLDPLFGLPVAVTRPRRDHDVELPDGCVVFLYTDGLVERRGQDLDDGTAQLVATLARHRALPPQELVDVTVASLASSATDDVVAVAVRL